MMQPFGRVAEKRRLLFEINVDTAEENRRAAALVLLVQRHRQVKRHHEHLVPELAQRGDERIVAETIPAIHAARAGSYLNDVHFSNR